MCVLRPAGGPDRQYHRRSGPPVVEEVVQDSLLIMITGGAVFWRIQYIAGPGRPRAAGLTPGSTGQTICMIYCFGGFVRNRTSVRERMIVHFSPILVCARTLASKTGLHRLALGSLARSLAGRARSARWARYMSRQSMVHLYAASGRGRCSIETHSSLVRRASHHGQGASGALQLTFHLLI